MFQFFWCKCPWDSMGFPRDFHNSYIMGRIIYIYIIYIYIYVLYIYIYIYHIYISYIYISYIHIYINGNSADFPGTLWRSQTIAVG